MMGRFLAKSICFQNVRVCDVRGVLGCRLRVKGKRVVSVDEPPHPKDLLIDGQGGFLIPGLINAHDHLELNHFKRLKFRDRYSHARQWVEDFETRFDVDPDITEPRKTPLGLRLLLGGLKNLLAGVTTVCHHNPLYPVLKKGFPIGVVQRFGFCHSLYRGQDIATSYRRTPSNVPWIIHLAEGTDAEAAAEFETLQARGLLQANTLIVHGVGLTGLQRRRLRDHGGGLIWCPASNHFLFGATARVGVLARAGKLALGTDSRLSGSQDLLAELREAAATNQLEPQQLFRAVTVDAANLLGIGKTHAGRIIPGGPADLVLLPATKGLSAAETLIGIGRSQLQLVMRAGIPLMADAPLGKVFQATKTPVSAILVDGQTKLLAQSLEPPKDFSHDFF